MSQIEHAKKEAKRLLKLAKNLTPYNEPISLPITNLGQAREHIAVINGYPNWYDYETSFKNKETQHNKLKHYQQKELEELKALTFSPKEFIIHISNPIKNEINEINNVKSIDLILGTETQINKHFIHDTKKILTHTVTEFPIVLFGANSSGRSHAALSLISQWIKNQEGYIVFDSGTPLVGVKNLNEFIKKHDNQKEVYYLNFLNTYSENFDPEQVKKLNLDSIDPINPLIGNDPLFKLLFGDKFGLIVHEIAKITKRKNQLIDYTNIQAMMSLVNLKNWVNDKTWGEATSFIEKYLLENNDESHLENCIQANEYIKLIEKYTVKGTFSINPTITIKEILFKQSILHCMLSAWHSEGRLRTLQDELPFKEVDYPKVTDIVLLQIHQATEQLNSEYVDKDYWQNISMMEWETSISNHVCNYVLKNLSSKNKWLFSGYIPCNETEDYQTIEEMNKLVLIDIGNTISLMQSNTYASEIPTKLKLKLFNLVKNLTNIFYYKSIVLSEQPPGEGHVMIKINGQYEFIKMKLSYESFK